MKRMTIEEIIGVQSGVLQTLISYYDLKPKTLIENPEILHNLASVTTELLELNTTVSDLIDEDYSNRTKLVEKRGRIFTIIDGDRK